MHLFLLRALDEIRISSVEEFPTRGKVLPEGTVENVNSSSEDFGQTEPDKNGQNS